jgi:hypothetical protein
MIERDQIMFGIVWPALAATVILLGLWRLWPRGPHSVTRARIAGALAIAIAAIIAVWRLLGGLSLPPTGVGPAIAIAAAIAAAIAMIPARGKTAVALGAATGLLCTAAVCWPWMAAGRARSGPEFAMVAAMVGAGVVFAGLARALSESARREPSGWLPLGLGFGIITGATAPLLAIGGAWTNAALVTGAVGLALLSSFLMTIGGRAPHHGLAASIGALGGILPATLLAAHLGSELPWWSGLIIALSPAGWLAGSFGPLARRGSKARAAARLIAMSVIAGSGVLLAIMQAPIDSYLDYVR